MSAPEGGRHRAKVSRSLSLPRQIGGADRMLALANGFVTTLLIYACGFDPLSPPPSWRWASAATSS